MRAELLHAVASHHDRNAARTAEAAVLYHANQLDAVAATRPGRLVLAIALALGASVSWGLGDFLGGLKSRGLHVLAVLAISQAAGLAPRSTGWSLRRAVPAGRRRCWQRRPGPRRSGSAALYRGMAIGAMGIVAPISAVAAVIPFAVGVARASGRGRCSSSGSCSRSQVSRSHRGSRHTAVAAVLPESASRWSPRSASGSTSSSSTGPRTRACPGRWRRRVVSRCCSRSCGDRGRGVAPSRPFVSARAGRRRPVRRRRERPLRARLDAGLPQRRRGARCALPGRDGRARGGLLHERMAPTQRVGVAGALLGAAMITAG